MEKTKNANFKSRIEIKHTNININFKANLIASRNLFQIDHNSDTID